MKQALGLLRSWFVVLTALFFMLVGGTGRVEAHELVANPDDLQIEVQSPGGLADENGERVAGPAKIKILYQAPSDPDISTVRVKLKGATATEMHPASPDYNEPPPLYVADVNNPTYLEPVLDDNGNPTGQFKGEVPWPTRSFHNGRHIVTVGLDVTVTFVDGHSHVLEYVRSLIVIVCNLTVTDLTGVTPLPPTAQLALLGEPQDNQAVPPLAEPAFILAQGGSKTFTCVLNTTMGSAVRLRYQVFSCDDPDALLTTHEEDVSTAGMSADGKSTPCVFTWSWDGTKTVGVWDEFDNYHEEQVPVERGVYQVRITADVYEAYEGEGLSLVDSDSTRSTRTCWPAYSMYSPAINLAYGPLLEGGTRELNVSYALRLSGETVHIADGVATRLEAFTRVYDPAPGPLERVGNVVEGPALAQVINPSLTANQAALQVPWNEKANRAEKILLTAKDRAGFDRGHREKWNLGQTRKVIDGEAEKCDLQGDNSGNGHRPRRLAARDQ